jgi:hypothetical protein
VGTAMRGSLIPLLKGQGSISLKIPHPSGGNISQCHLGENIQGGREKGGKCIRKIKKGEEKGRKKRGKKNRKGEVKG